MGRSSHTDYSEITKMLGGGFLLDQSFCTRTAEGGQEELVARCFIGKK